MKARDDFPEPVKRLLALRAAHRCCNPKCRRLTIKPTDNGLTVSSGIAAHICGAAPGGARYDAAQTPEDRAAAANGIWVCHICSDNIDKDSKRYPIEMLREWRVQHETWVASEDLVPSLPVFTVKTLDGFSLPTRPGRIDFTDLADIREHSITLSAFSRHELEHLKIRVQFPEPVVSFEVVQAPPGVAVSVQPERVRWQASATGGGSVTINRPPRPSPNFLIDLDRLVPRRDLVIHVLTTLGQNPFGAVDPLYNKDDALATYASGEFLYREGGQMFDRHFIVPLEINNGRSVSSQVPEENHGTRALLESMFWG